MTIDEWVGRWVGRKYGRLTVIGHGGYYIQPTGKKRSLALCRCECGVERRIWPGCLATGETQSCGCLQRERLSAKKWKGCGAISGSFWKSIKWGAKDRDIPFGITIEFAWDLFLKQEGRCALTGIPLFMTRAWNSGRGEGNGHTASLDRIKSSGGYAQGNVWWVHSAVNWMKHVLTTEELVNWCGLIVNGPWEANLNKFASNSSGA